MVFGREVLGWEVGLGGLAGGEPARNARTDREGSHSRFCVEGVSSEGGEGAPHRAALRPAGALANGGPIGLASCRSPGRPSPLLETPRGKSVSASHFGLSDVPGGLSAGKAAQPGEAPAVSK